MPCCLVFESVLGHGLIQSPGKLRKFARYLAVNVSKLNSQMFAIQAK